METPDLERIRFTTRHFHDLQGLRFGVPLGLILLGLGSPAMPRLALFLGALLLILGARRYYRRYGEVERPIDPDMDLYPVSIFNLAGPISRLHGHRQVTPVARCLLVTAVLVVLPFAYFQALPPNIVIQGDVSLGQHPQVTSESAPYFGPAWIKEYPNGGRMRPPSMLKAVFAQTAYVLSGALFLGLWLWRGRRLSQGYHLALAVPLLGLAAFGTSLGFFARADGEIPRLLDLVLPALVYPGVALSLCGAAMILAGLLDHWQLVRALGWPEAEEE
ncbi:MAG TPA: hypothetical protein VF789_13135 [Thermoanaerobaculia bacterium]